MFFTHPSIIAAYSGRPLGNMSLSFGLAEGRTEESLRNRKAFLLGVGIDHSALVCAQQVHGNLIRRIVAADRGRGAIRYTEAFADTDALITDVPALPLAVFTADCPSVFLFDPVHSSIGIIHAGWRSSLQKICAKTVWAMKWEFKSRPEDLLVGFGPAIGQCCYEVGAEFADFFPQALSERGGKFFLDLAAVNRQQLVAEGVGEAHITDPGICTFCRRSEYFSYRREGPSCGRQVSVIMLR